MPTFDTPDPIKATIDVVAGDVHIDAGERAVTTISVEPSDARDAEDRRAAEQTRVEYANGRLLVKQPKLRSWLPRGTGGSIAVAVELPAGSDVQGDAAMADFTSEGPLAEVRLKTGLGRISVAEAGALSVKNGIGDISVDHAARHADVTSGSGEVRMRELAESAVIRNSNGDTWVGAAHGDLRVSAANGNIAIDVAHASVAAKSANGDVRLGDAARGSAVLETKLGDVEIGIREGTAAWLDVRASAGRVHNALEAAEAPGESADTVEVRARTVAGDVVIRRP